MREYTIIVKKKPNSGWSKWSSIAQGENPLEALTAQLIPLERDNDIDVYFPIDSKVIVIDNSRNDQIEYVIQGYETAVPALRTRKIHPVSI